jgi:chromosome segregation ATPase
METALPTPHQIMGDMQNKIDRLSENLDTANVRIADLTKQLYTTDQQKSAYHSQLNEIKDQVTNVRNHIFEIYAMNGEIDEDIKIIADLLEIVLTRRVEGTASIEVSFSFDAPIDFDIDDFELSIDVTEDSFEIENFEWNEERIDIDCEEV